MRPLALDHAGGAFTGELHLPPGDGPHPGVLVMHNALGLGAQVREVAATLAGLGYVALATDMFGAALDGDPATAGAYFEALRNDPALLRDRLLAWHARFAALPEVDPARIAAIGYCFGGLCVLELARAGADVKAVASFHGLLETALPAAPGAIAGQVAVWTGALDPFVPLPHVEAFRAEMTAAGVSLQLTLFADARHSFTDRHAARLNRPGIGYDALADRVSWAGTLALLDHTLLDHTLLDDTLQPTSPRR